MTLLELREQLQGQYPEGSAEQLLETEKKLSFSDFNSETAWKLGNRMVCLSKKYGEGVTIIIIRESDGLPIFQYVSDDRAQRNIDFAMGKRNTVLKTGHCSLWVMAQEQTHGGMETYFREDNGCLPVGGAFPVYVDGKLSATIAVSGLHNGMDHQLILETLAEYFHMKTPEFQGTLI